MSTIQLAEEIEALPANLQEQARDFVAFLKTRHPQPEKRQLGDSKGLITMADNSGEPLKDFKEHR